MAWQDDMNSILRVLISDDDEVEADRTFSDDKLERVLIVAAFQVSYELDFDNTYVINIANSTISPDPTLTATKDESFTNLVTLKAACILDRGSANIAANRAIAVKDADSAIDLRRIFISKLELLKQGWCAVYEDTKLEYQMSSNQVAGAAVMTPFRLFAFGNRGYCGGERHIY